MYILKTLSLYASTSISDAHPTESTLLVKCLRVFLRTHARVNAITGMRVWYGSYHFKVAAITATRIFITLYHFHLIVMQATHLSVSLALPWDHYCWLHPKYLASFDYLLHAQINLIILVLTWMGPWCRQKSKKHQIPCSIGVRDLDNKTLNNALHSDCKVLVKTHTIIFFYVEVAPVYLHVRNQFLK